MKKLFTILLVLGLNMSIYSQEDKPVYIIVSGSGKTSEDARVNALNSAIEQTYGAYISSKTEVLNDSIISDEIVSISSGNIISYKVLHETETGELHNILIEATISINKLVTFAQSKGFEVQVNGSGFAANLKQQRLNEKAEIIAIRNSLTAAIDILHSGFDYILETKEPVLSDQLNSLWTVETIVTGRSNDNFSKAQDIVRSLLNDISLSEKEVEQYRAIGKPVYEIKYHDLEFDEPFLYYLRTSDGLWEFIRFAYKIPALSLRYNLADGIKYEYNGLMSLIDKKCDVSLNDEINKILYQYFFVARNYGMQFDGANGGQMSTVFESIVSCQRSGNKEYLKNYSDYINLKNKLYPLDPYYFFSPKLLVTTFDFHNCEMFGYYQDISQSRFKLVYSEDELNKLSTFACKPLLMEETPVDQDLKPYIDVTYYYDKDVLPSRTSVDDKTQSYFTINSGSSSQLKIDLRYINRTILERKLEEQVDQLKEISSNLEPGQYDVYLHCIVNRDGTVSMRPFSECKIDLYRKADIITQRTRGGNKRTGDILTEENVRTLILNWVEERINGISNYPPAVLGKEGGNQMKMNCYKTFHFTFYID